MLYKYRKGKQQYILVRFKFCFSFAYFRGVFDKTMIPLPFVGYEM